VGAYVSLRRLTAVPMASLARMEEPVTRKMTAILPAVFRLILVLQHWAPVSLRRRSLLVVATHHLSATTGVLV
jgi:hypothetical protein